MSMFKSVVIATLLIGSASLALAQNGPMSPGQGPSPAAPTSGASATSPAKSGQTQSMHKKKTRHLYNMATSKKKHRSTPTQSKTSEKKSQSM
jgi:hypothetical protein